MYFGSKKQGCSAPIMQGIYIQRNKAVRLHSKVIDIKEKMNTA
jgi:hypothetical protein